MNAGIAEAPIGSSFAASYPLITAASAVAGAAIESPDLCMGTLATMAGLYGVFAEQPDALTATATLNASLVATMSEQADTVVAGVALTASVGAMATEQADLGAGYIGAVAISAMVGNGVEQIDIGAGLLTAILALAGDAIESADSGSGSASLIRPLDATTATPAARTLPVLGESRFPLYLASALPSAFRRDLLGYFIWKDPGATLDYQLDWAATTDSWLGGDEIVSSAWTVDTGLDQVIDSHTRTTATVWLAGGAAGGSYNVTCRIDTAAGRVDDRSFRVIVRDQ